MDSSLSQGHRDTVLSGLHEAAERQKARARFFLSLLQTSGDQELWQGYCDGSAHPGQTKVGVGGFLVSPAGEITGEFAEVRRGSQSDHAEWQAIERLLERAREAGIRKLIVHTDNQGLAALCEGGFRSKNRTQLKGDIADWRPAFDMLRFIWIPRNENGLADWLSRYCDKHKGWHICQPVYRQPTLNIPCFCVSPAPLVAPVVKIEPAALVNPAPRSPVVPLVTTALAQPWCQQLLAHAEEWHGQVPQALQVEPWMLEAAASYEQRRRAHRQAEMTGQSYEQLLEQALQADVTAQPFDAWLHGRLQQRMQQVSVTRPQPASAAWPPIAPAARPQPIAAPKKKRGGLYNRLRGTALAQHLRAERARSIHVEFCSEGLYLATSSDGHTQYEVDTIKGSCTCPDFDERGHYLRCKHLIAAMNLETELSRQERAARAA